MKVMKTVVLTVAAVLMIGVLFAGAVSADASGNCGKQGSNLQWAFSDSNKTLVITGSGEMVDYNSVYDVPWKDNKSSITSVTLPSGLKNIGDYAFSWCSSLTSIAIPASVTTIGQSAFLECSALTEVTFADGSKLKEIGEYAFFYCTALTSIEIPASVTTIGTRAFASCKALKTVTLAKGSKLKTIGDAAFSKTGLTSIEIPASVTTIGGEAFGETGLTSIEIPANVETISGKAFYKSNALTTVSFADVSNLATIGRKAFSKCTALKKVILKKGTFPATATFGSAVFENCNNFSTVISDKLQTPAVMANFTAVQPDIANQGLTNADPKNPVWYISEIQTSALPEGYEEYYICFLNGGNMKANFEQKKVGNAFILPTASDVTRTGYTFSKWINDDGKEVTTLTGTTKHAMLQWNPNNRGHSASIPKDYTPSSSVPVMVQETVKPTTAPTLAAPTAMPTTKPTTQATTSKSPAPFVGLIAGLGVAGIVLTRMRR